MNCLKHKGTKAQRHKEEKSAPSRKKRDERASVLIVAIGMLAILSLLAITFAKMTQMELAATRNYTDTVHADVVVKGGMSYAIARIRYDANYGALTHAVDVYSKDLGVGSSFQHPWYCNPSIVMTDTENPPDDFFAFDDGTTGSARWSSYALGDTSRTAEFAVRIFDCGSQIYLNDASDGIVNMLNNLGTILRASQSTIGTALITNYRDSGGAFNNAFTTKDEVLGVLTAATAQYDYGILKNFITAHAVTYSIIDPDSVPLGFQERSFINVNSASKEVLVAALAGLSDGTNTLSVADIEPSDNDTDCEKVAQAIIDNRPIVTWVGTPSNTDYKSFHNVVEAAAAANATFTYAEAAVVFANCVPSSIVYTIGSNSMHENYGITDLLGFGSAPIKRIGKNDLTVSSVEFSLDSGGIYEIQSWGRIKDAQNRVIADKRMTEVVKLYDTVRLSSQDDFEGSAGNTGTKTNVQTYPEYDPDSTASITAATYDGTIGIVADVSNAASQLLNTFNEDSDSANDEFKGDAEASPQDDPASPPLEANIADGGVLFPDGAYFGGTDILTYPHLNNVDACDGLFEEGSVEMWIKFDEDVSSSMSGTRRLFDYVATNPLEYVTLYFDPMVGTQGQFILEVSDEDNSGAYVTYSRTADMDPGGADITNTWQAGEWHHVAASWDWDTNDTTDAAGPPTPPDPNDVIDLKLEIDGVLMGSFTGTDGVTVDLTTSGASANFTIGNISGGTEPVKGVIDEIMITNAVLFTAFAKNRYLDSSTWNTSYYESPVIDLGYTVAEGLELGTITWTEYIPDSVNTDVNGSAIIDSGADIGLHVQTDDNNAAWGGWISTSPDFTNPEADNLISSVYADNRYIQFKVNFKATSASALRETPVLDDVSIRYMMPVEILYTSYASGQEAEVR